MSLKHGLAKIRLRSASTGQQSLDKAARRVIRKLKSSAPIEIGCR